MREDPEGSGGGDLCCGLVLEALVHQSLYDGFASDRPGRCLSVDAEDSGPLQDFRVRDPILPFQLQYSAEAAELELIQLPGLVRVDGPGLRSVKEFCQDDGLVHFQFGVLVNTVAIPHGGLQPAEGLTCFGDPLGNLIIDSRVA
ncbi:unnamed protein product [Schistocephalus solidus]|uniref:VOC domain-containing protein n=1 Tax=Schistocephalus solidus TaxID=70667 RepID=A0A183T7Y5_SCHSO|nr:unnamed protein product [Schistocephalus solidus]